MTSVQITFRYDGLIRPEMLPRTQERQDYFGIRKMRLDEANRLITVDYDATRLDAAGVTAVLRRVGIPVVERVPATEPRPA